jgi:hypothetical protein
LLHQRNPCELFIRSAIMRPIVSVARPAPAAHRISYDPAAKPKSDLYRDLLPLINGRRVDLLLRAALLAQLCGLERRTARGGRDSIDHAPGAHNDVAAVAGVAAAGGRYCYNSTMAWVSGPRRTRRRRAGVAAGEVRRPPECKPQLSDGGDSFRALVGLT